MNEKWRKKWKNMSLKRTYYLMMGGLIGLPILLVFLGSFYLLNQKYKEQSIENIKQMHQTLIADLDSDLDEISMRMTTMIYANDYEVMRYAAGTNTEDMTEKSENRKKLDQVENLYLEPNKEVISLHFKMKEGEDTFLKSYVEREKQEVEKQKWYKSALKEKNKVYIGSFDTTSSGDLFVGGKKDMFILIAVLSPDSNTDKSGKIEMIELYQSSKVADRVKANNRDYLSEKNNLGIARITDEKGNCLFTTVKEKEVQNPKYLCIKSPMKVYDTTWYIESYVKPSELTEDFRRVAAVMFGIALLLFVLLSYYSSYFIKSIVKPIEEVNEGLKEVESGRLDVHITASGQFEIRSMIHQFNAMVRQLRTFFREYEEKLQSGRNSAYYFREMMAGRMAPKEVAQEYEAFFKDAYTVLGMYIYDHNVQTLEQTEIQELLQEFSRNSRYASRCCSYVESGNVVYLFYRITEQDYKIGLHQMIQELQMLAERNEERTLFFCEGKRCELVEEFLTEVEAVRRGMQFRYLVPKNFRLEEREVWENKGKEVLTASEALEMLVGYAFFGDEKNLVSEREQIFKQLRTRTLDEMKLAALGMIIAAGRKAEQNHDSITQIFGRQYNYFDKIDRLDDERSLRMWVTNFLNWILDYSVTKLDVKENDMIVLAKRYLQDHYDNPDLSLNEVAAYVGLNEKYFSNRFTKEAGETVSGYLTAVRMQKAKEILKTTNFKVYEVAEMVGYHNVEHFNRVFKKTFQISPSKYRKSETV